MIRILQIRETPSSKCAGVDSNCQGLIALFSGDNQIEMLPVLEYTRHTDCIIHQHWLDRKEICESIEKYKPDIIHVHGATSFTLYVAVKCAKMYNKRIVLSPHFHPFYALKRPFLGRVFFELITKYILKYIDLVFTINNEDTDQFNKYHKCVVKTPHWSRFERPVSKLKKDPKMILFIGRLNESNKGFRYLYHLPEGRFNIHCVGPGDVELRSDMVKHTNISDDELKELYKRASLLVVPSRYEAFSYVTIEALMCNTPVVLSDRVRIADHLHGIKGYSTFKYQDYTDFVKAVEEMIGENVDVKQIEEVFNPNKIKDIYKKSYLKVFQK